MKIIFIEAYRDALPPIPGHQQVKLPDNLGLQDDQIAMLGFRVKSLRFRG